MRSPRHVRRIPSHKPSGSIRVAVALIALVALAAPARAQLHESTLLEGEGSTQKYIIELAGTVLHETFSGVTASLQISGAPMGSPHPYLLIIEGYPDAQMRNAFYWNSGHSTMDASANTLTCTIRPGFPPAPDLHFFYLSPALLKRPVLTHQDAEDNRETLTTAVPVKVFAQAGELRLTISPGSVTGTIWMQGYDTIEQSYVRYSATLSGRRAIHVDQTIQRKHR